MGYGEGVVWSLVAAVAHSAIDVLRKLGSQRMQPADLVAVVTVYDAIIATIGVYVVDGGLPDISAFPNKNVFLIVVCVTSTLAVIARLLYQRALSIAPLSLTVPYLAFTPAFVVCISPLFLVGEVPSPLGMLGVFIVSVSGYLLGLVTSPTAAGSHQQPCSPSKLKLPVVAHQPRTSWGGPGSQKHQLQHQQQQQQALLPLPAQQLHQQQQQQQQHRAAGHAPLHEDWRSNGALMPQISHDTPLLQDGRHNHSSSGGGRSNKGSQTSIWAMAYYKHKTPYAAGVNSTNIPGLALQLSTAAAAAAAPDQAWSSSVNGSSSSSNCNVPQQLGGVGGSSGSTASSGVGDGGSNWDDSQAKQKELKGLDAKSSNKRLPPFRVARLLQEPSRRGETVKQRYKRWKAALASPSAAPAIVLTVAFIYSFTASLDKVGIAAADYSLSAYFLAQRLLIGVAGLLYLLCFARHALRHIYRDMLLLLSLSVVEQGSVVFYLLAIENILVSYVVAIKRVNVLLSTLVGCVLFKENVSKRIPYILVMLCGMLLIVLQPGHEDLHHSHHTRHLQQQQ